MSSRLSGPAPPAVAAAIRLTRDAAAATRMLDAYAAAGHAVSTRRRRAALEPLLPAIVASLDDSNAVGRDWRIFAVLPTASDRSVAMIGSAAHAEVALKIAESKAAAAGLDREERNLATLRDDARFASWRHHAPSLVGHGTVEGRRFTAENAFDGPTLRELLGPGHTDVALAEAVDAVRDLHAATAAVTTAGDGLLDAWVDGPIGTLNRTLDTAGRLGCRERLLEGVVRDTIRSRLLSAPLAVGFVHGDFFPDNVLMSPASRVLGLVDWENAQADAPVSLDLLTMLLSVRMQRRRRELGSIVLGLLEEGRLSDEEHAWLRCDELLDPDLFEGLVLLAWLHLVSATAAKAPRSASRPVWLTLNVDAVLAFLQERSGSRTTAYGGQRAPRASARTALRRGLDGALDELRFRLDVIAGADYQPLPGAHAAHLDTVKRDAGSWSRLEQIAKVVTEVGAVTAVDVGANAGFFSIGLAERGLDVAAVERDPRFARIIAHRARHAGLAATVAPVELTIDARTVELVPAVDAVLFLSVWHHLVRRDGIEQADAVLRALWARAREVLFFDTGQDEMGPAFGLPAMTPSAREWMVSHLEGQCEHGAVEWLGSHQAFGPRHEPAMRELFVVRREQV
ncbi:MAG TPA: phosphotransferase [Thermoleophilia bacterium]|nr:phosphotransferase [Thermoleophilia bacterium]